MKNNNSLIFSVLLVLGLVILAFWGRFNAMKDGMVSPSEKKSITNFYECRDAGYPIMESYPERCAVPGGETFSNPDQILTEFPENITSSEKIQ